MIPRRDFIKTFGKIGLLSFGGPAGQIALMHRVLVDEKNWISDARFLHALNFCMLLPGPEAAQLAIYIGWLLHRTWGGFVAGLLFILPGAAVMTVLSIIYVEYHQLPVVDGFLYGLKAAVLAVVIEATLRIGRRSLRNTPLRALAGLSFAAIFFFDVPFPLIIIAAALAGMAAAQWRPDISVVPVTTGVAARAPSVIDNMFAQNPPPAPSLRRLARSLATGLSLWLFPVATAVLLLPQNNVFSSLGLFFSKMAVVTFGGAYAALSYVAQQAVQNYRWLEPADMLNGLGLAETTPGPLILVLQYVGFVAGFRNASGLSPLLSALLGAAITLWVTFVPCFLWIFAGAPYVERAHDHLRLKAGLTAITAAVTGVVLNLAVWLGLHTIFTKVSPYAAGPFSTILPDWSSIDPRAFVLSVFASVCLFRLKLGVGKTLAICALLGLVVKNFAF